MFRISIKCSAAALFMAVALAGAPVAAADGEGWRIGKSTGQVWVVRGDLQKISAGQDSDLQPGDSIRTGATGRVLLTRGEERITVSPNSSIGIAAASGDYPTTVTQQAGSIVLEVEKKNVQHFEVETPYLAAVVKGTQFRVSVDRRGAKVEVREGQVQVSDHKSGDTALVLPGQAAKVAAFGKPGLTLSGQGKFNAIEHGTPRRSTVHALSVPKKGLSAPRNSTRHLTTQAGHGAGKNATIRAARGGVKIAVPLGEIKLDVRKATNGLAHSSNDARAYASQGDGSNSANNNGGNGNGNGLGLNNGNAFGNGNSNGHGNGKALGQGNGNTHGKGSGRGNGNSGGGHGNGSGHGGGDGDGDDGDSDGNGGNHGHGGGGSSGHGQSGKGKGKG